MKQKSSNKHPSLSSRGFIQRQKSGVGFTLIELLVVIAIIGLLASVVLVSLNSARGKARETKRLADIKQLQTALELYYDANNAYPSDPGYAFSDTANSVITGPTKALGPFLTKVPNDPLYPSWSSYYYVGNATDYGIYHCREIATPSCCYVKTSGGPASGWWGVSACP